ncbi:hypothetical protein O4J56_14610 [Nocardiopsis sp. RSe5-2]|uniref:DUF1795 domain-containing protein n=1 Tax=Nocardiopsis endophytica TaxID=3018445 RepID=A0ABT4U685_9ACTN|nr:hypothetical protein [Nocardiopsis endophytica]MDA2811872.1 hypothetical protein [Nocardiopsis endophytica]
MAYAFEDSLIPPEAEIGFDIGIPDTWTQYDLSADGIAELRGQLLQAAGADADAEQMSRLNEVFSTMATIAQDSRSSGLLSAAGTLERYEDGFFMATVCVMSFREPPGHELDPIKLLDYIHPPSSTADEGTWLRKTVVELPESGADLCGRMYGVADYKLDQATGEAFRAVLMHTAFRVPGLDKRVVVSCSSPNVELQDEILQLFDAITGTAWFWKRLPQNTG